MSETPLIVSDLDLVPPVEDSRMYGLDIDVETVRGDDMPLFTPDEMELLRHDPNNYHIVEEMDMNRTDNESFNKVGLDERHTMQMMTDENFTKHPIELAQMCNLDATKVENSSHVVYYKMQDRKQSKVWECGICGKGFEHQQTLVKHLTTDERIYQCNTCGKGYKQLWSLSQHRASHSADLSYTCEVCQKTFNRIAKLISHRKTHTGLKPRRFHLCNKAFCQKGNLVNHNLTHTNEQPNKCDIDSKGYTVTMSNLMCYKLKAPQRADRPKFVCQTCGKDFQKRTSLQIHQQYHHGVPGQEATTSNNAAPTRNKYTNSVLVKPINTAAMQHAVATNQTPFTLVKPLSRMPVLVTALSVGEKQMLVPVTADENKENVPDLTGLEKDNETVSVKPLATTVQIKIPVVATEIQNCGQDGRMFIAVESPRPNNDDGMVDNNIYVTTTNENAGEVSVVPNFDNSEFFNITLDKANNIQEAVNDCGQILHAGNDFQNNDQEIIGQIQNENLLNISYDHPIYEVLNKSETITMYSAETADLWFQDVNMVDCFFIE